MKRGPLHVHIDELVLEGFEPAQRHQIADAVERELTRVLETAEVRNEIGAMVWIARHDAGAFFVSDRSAAGIGQDVARAVGGSVTGALNSPVRSSQPGEIR